MNPDIDKKPKKMFKIEATILDAGSYLLSISLFNPRPKDPNKGENKRGKQPTLDLTPTIETIKTELKNGKKPNQIHELLKVLLNPDSSGQPFSQVVDLLISTPAVQKLDLHLADMFIIPFFEKIFEVDNPGAKDLVAELIEVFKEVNQDAIAKLKKHYPDFKNAITSTAFRNDDEIKTTVSDKLKARSLENINKDNIFTRLQEITTADVQENFDLTQSLGHSVGDVVKKYRETKLKIEPKLCYDFFYSELTFREYLTLSDKYTGEFYIGKFIQIITKTQQYLSTKYSRVFKSSLRPVGISSEDAEKKSEKSVSGSNLNTVTAYQEKPKNNSTNKKPQRHSYTVMRDAKHDDYDNDSVNSDIEENNSVMNISGRNFDRRFSATLHGHTYTLSRIPSGEGSSSPLPSDGGESPSPPHSPLHSDDEGLSAALNTSTSQPPALLPSNFTYYNRSSVTPINQLSDSIEAIDMASPNFDPKKSESNDLAMRLALNTASKLVKQGVPEDVAVDKMSSVLAATISKQIQTEQKNIEERQKAWFLRQQDNGKIPKTVEYSPITFQMYYEPGQPLGNTTPPQASTEKSVAKQETPPSSQDSQSSDDQKSETMPHKTGLGIFQPSNSSTVSKINQAATSKSNESSSFSISIAPASTPPVLKQ